MATLHIENTVNDYDQWKLAFDRYSRMRAEHGVRSYRVSRRTDDPNQVTVDLEFDTVDAAGRYREVLFKIWGTPLSKAQLAAHGAPTILEVVEQVTSDAVAL